MQKNIITCDVCDKEITGAFYHTIKDITRSRINGDYTMSSDDYDICDDCYNELVDCLNTLYDSKQKEKDNG